MNPEVDLLCLFVYMLLTLCACALYIVTTFLKADFYFILYDDASERDVHDYGAGAMRAVVHEDSHFRWILRQVAIATAATRTFWNIPAPSSRTEDIAPHLGNDGNYFKGNQEDEKPFTHPELHTNAFASHSFKQAAAVSGSPEVHTRSNIVKKRLRNGSFIFRYLCPHSMCVFMSDVRTGRNTTQFSQSSSVGGKGVLVEKSVRAIRNIFFHHYEL